MREVTVIPGDGIGPEVVDAAVTLVEAAGVKVDWDRQEAGKACFEAGIGSGVPDATIESLQRTRVALKGPLETPVGYGGKSANVTLRKLFETYANVRPVRELPGVPTPYSGRGVDLVVVRENVEDLYAGIEHMQTPDVAQCLKLISRPGCEKIARTAFELARSQGRRSVHCATKANIMKLTEGTLQRVFLDVASDYPDIEASHVIVDNCAHQLVKRPEQFEVIVTTNMNGDILSDLTSALVGGLGFAPSANLGGDVAIFEAVHGSAPKYAGQDVANPTAVVLSAVLMLRHLEEFDAADDLEQAVVATLADGIHPKDVPGGEPVGTRAFTEAVAARIGTRPGHWPVREHRPLRLPAEVPASPAPESRGELGVDVFVESRLSPAELGPQLEGLAEGGPFRLALVSNRGTRVWPPTGAEPDCVDHFRCRFLLREPGPGTGSGTGSATGSGLPDREVAALLSGVTGLGLRWMHVEKLLELDGAPAYSRAQGE